jgi:hypothetical protein
MPKRVQRSDERPISDDLGGSRARYLKFARLSLSSPTASAPDIQSIAPFAINDIQASTRNIPAVDLGFVGLSLEVTPIIYTNIDSFILGGVTISGSVAKAESRNVSAPIASGGVNLKSISIGPIDVANIPL